MVAQGHRDETLQQAVLGQRLDVLVENLGLDVAKNAQGKVVAVDRARTHAVHLIRLRLVADRPCRAVLTAALITHLVHPRRHLVKVAQQATGPLGGLTHELLAGDVLHNELGGDWLGWLGWQHGRHGVAQESVS